MGERGGEGGGWRGVLAEPGLGSAESMFMGFGVLIGNEVGWGWGGG